MINFIILDDFNTNQLIFGTLDVKTVNILNRVNLNLSEILNEITTFSFSDFTAGYDGLSESTDEEMSTKIYDLIDKIKSKIKLTKEEYEDIYDQIENLYWNGYKYSFKIFQQKLNLNYIKETPKQMYFSLKNNILFFND